MSRAPEIEKDLVQWSPRFWTLLVLLLVALQLLGIFTASTTIHARSAYPKTPLFELGSRRAPSLDGELDDPLLFAIAHRNGFSGQAWMQPPLHSEQFFGTLPPPSFLSLFEANQILSLETARGGEDLPALLNYHMAPDPLTVEVKPPSRRSALRLEGPIASRRLVSNLQLPQQVYNDVLGSSVVQVTVDGDGTVVSARLAESSGFKKADLDAIALARQARFGQMKNASTNDFDEVQFGKLIFDWFALELGSTNAVRR